MKKNFLLLAIALWLFMVSARQNVFAADVEVILDTADGTSALSVKDSGSAEVASIDSDGNIQLSGTITQGGVALVPSGVIVMWSGTLASIPSGWVLCNGSNGTPDLRDRFIVGASAGANPGTTGGASTHSHGTGTYATSAHSGTAVDAHAAHQHNYTQVINHVHVQNGPTSASGGAGTFGWDSNSSNSSTATQISTANPTGSVGATGVTADPNSTLTHTVTQPSAHTLSGSSETVSNVPAYYALAFIMKT